MARRSDHTRSELTELALKSASEIVAKEGISALSGRKIAARMGYTVGTLYQVFNDMDDLVEQMNTQTLAALFEHCRGGSDRADVASRLKALGLLFMEFVRENPHAWDAVMSYRYKEDHTTSAGYALEISRLFGLMNEATADLYGSDETEQHANDMAMLWASLTGILGIANSERNVGGSLELMLDSLVAMFVRARSN